MHDLRFAYEWERGDGVAAPELAATWARLEVWVGGRCVTRVEDAESGSARRSIYCSLYPLAEWIAFNWWLLNSNIRPAAFPARAGLLSAQHNIRAAGDGFVWPDLSVLPQGDLTRVVWRSDDGSLASGSPIRYITGGEAFVAGDAVQVALAGVVESVLARLEEMGIASSSLEEEWQAITDAQPEEIEFCRGAALLGVDPYSIDSDTASVLAEIAQELDGQLRDDFLGAVDPLQIRADLDWVAAQHNTIDEIQGEPNARLEFLRKETRLPHRSPAVLPWELGYQQAAEVREILGVSLVDRFELSGLIEYCVRTSQDPAIQGLGGFSRSGSSALVAGIKSQQRTDVRFASTRGIWHFAYDVDPHRFLLTGGRADQPRTERAFAAELLAPASGIQQLVPEDGGLVAAVDLDQIAEHFDVGPLVVRHQVENRLSLQVVD